VTVDDGLIEPESLQEPRPPRRGHFVVAGADSIAVRLVEELRRLRERVVVILPDPDTDFAQEIAESGAEVVVARRPNETALRDAGIASARAVGFVLPDDVGNVHGALTANELNPDIRIVVHIVNSRLREHIESLIANCKGVSTAELAAPQLVSAALDESEITWFNIGGRDVVAGPAELIQQPVIASLANVSGLPQTELLPAGRGDLVLGSALRGEPERRRPQLDDLRSDLGRAFDRRLRIVALTLVGLIVVGMLLVRAWPIRGGHVSWLDALYIAVSTVTSTGYDDPRAATANGAVRLAAIGVQLFGLVMVSLLTAAIVDVFVGEKLARSFGGIRGRPRGHFVVCGLGTVGTRVTELLLQRGFNVVAIERDGNKPGVQTARGLGASVIVGDVSNDDVLWQSRLHRCRGVIAATNEDVANLQAGLYARERNPEARIVLRLFEHDLAARVQEKIGIGTTRSVSILAAPRFVSEMTERRVDVTVSAGRRVLLVTEVPVEPGSQADGRPLAELAEAGALRILAHRSGEARWRWTPSDRIILRPGDRVALVASLAGLARALLRTRTGNRG
jgi:Trk K+ transport system NAD-binding subunit